MFFALGSCPDDPCFRPLSTLPSQPLQETNRKGSSRKPVDVPDPLVAAPRRRHAGREFLNGAGHAPSPGGAVPAACRPRPPARTCGNARRLYPSGGPRPLSADWLRWPQGAWRRRGAPCRAGSTHVRRHGGSGRAASTHPARSPRINQRGAICRPPLKSPGAAGLARERFGVVR